MSCMSESLPTAHGRVLCIDEVMLFKPVDSLDLELRQNMSDIDQMADRQIESN